MMTTRSIKKIIKILSIASVMIMMQVFYAFAAEENFDTVAEKLKGKTIAVLTGSTCEQIAQERFPESKLAYYDAVTDAYLSLQAKKTDAYLENEPGLSYLNSINNDVDVIKGDIPAEQMATMFPKNEKGKMLLSQYNEYVRKLYAEKKIEALKEKWVYGPEEDRISPDYESLPDTNGRLVIATDPTFAPFQYIKNNTIVGYEIEIVTGFCKEYGYKPVFEIVTFSGIISGISSGKYDMAASGLAITPERQKSGLFSDVIYDCGIAIAIPKETSSVSGGPFDRLKDGFYSTFLKEDRWKMFASGIGVTISITLLSILLGSLLGFVLYLVTRKNNRIAAGITNACKTIIQGFPMVVFLMVLYYVVFGKSSLSAEWVAIIAFSLTFACSVHGMLENAEAAVDPGQFEAAYSLGYNENKALLRYILPQSALFFLPDYKDEVVSHLKATAIVGYVAVVDVTKVGDIIRGRTYDAVFPLIAVTLVYFILSFVLKKLIDRAIYGVDTKNRSKETILKGLVIK